jgi:vancomycin resistance protein YoaR
MSDAREFPAVPADESAEEARRARRARGGTSVFAGIVPPQTALFAALAALALILGAVVVDAAVSSGRIHPGVRVGDVAVGAMTPDAAHKALVDAFRVRSAAPVTVAYGVSRWKVSAQEVDARLDATASVDAAMAVGRSGGFAGVVGQRISAAFGGVAVTPHVLGDTARIDALLDRIDADVAKPSRDASVSIQGERVSFVSSEAGRVLDRQRTGAAVLNAFLASSRIAQVVASPMIAAVSDADAKQAYDDATKLAAGPVTVTFGKAFVVVPRATVAACIQFQRRPVVTPAVELSKPATETTAPAGAAGGATQRMMLVASFDAKRVGAAISTLTQGLGRPARNASFVAGKGAVTIKPSQVGRGADLATLASDLARACVSDGQRSAVVRLVVIQPSLTTEAAREMGISDRISSFTTTYSAANPARTNNVHLLARVLDAKLVPPGGTFSFNGAAGQRTAAKGYQEAPAIVDGKLVPQLGGGVCQVGTTFFNAVFFSGLPVVERHNHSFYISHYPKGRDATVSWGGPDFKFRNDTAGWILIRTATTATSLTISLYGTDPGYRVEYTTSAMTNVVPFKVAEVKDPTLKKGARVMTDGGVDGGQITVVRTVYDKAGQLVRRDTFVSRYDSKDEIVRVGTKEPSKPATGTPSP